MIDLLRKLLGLAPVDHVVLRLCDKEHKLVRVTWHGQIPFAAPYLPDTACELLPGGAVIGPDYVKAWRPATKRMAEFHDRLAGPLSDCGSNER